MLDPVEEVRDIVEKLTPERQELVLKYARELYAAVKAGEEIRESRVGSGRYIK